jgi:predicted HTH transcriptional regulator
MDQLGLGAQRIITECKSLGAKAPAWKAETGSVTLTLFSAPALAASPDLSARQQDFLKSLKAGQAFKVGDYSASTKVSERQARRDLADLEKLSLVERQGAGPSTVYRLRT